MDLINPNPTVHARASDQQLRARSSTDDDEACVLNTCPKFFKTNLIH